MSLRTVLKKLSLCALVSLGMLLLGACTPKLSFSGSAEPVRADVTELTVVLAEGETSLLDQLPELRRADLRGSRCYDEIIAWAEAHPDVEVLYSIALPNGAELTPDAVTADLTGLAPEDIAEATALFRYLPRLSALILEPGVFSPAQVTELLCGGKYTTEYSFELDGQQVDYYADYLDLSRLSPAAVSKAAELLPQLPKLWGASLGYQGQSALSMADVAALVKACPNVKFDYSFYVYGIPADLNDRRLDLHHIPVTDGGAELLAAAECMRGLKWVDMDSCGLSTEQMLYLQQLLPDTRLVWRVSFGEKYSVRTDVEKILASQPSVGGYLSGKDVAALSCCVDVKYLDLGHNSYLSDISFVANMPELEVLIVAMDPITDISPLANCPKLEYLELQTNDCLVDISALAHCPELAHLNIARCRNISDITALYGLEKLERLWLGSLNQVPAEQLEHFRQTHPDCEINTTVWGDPTSEGWRIDSVDPWTNKTYYHPRYELLLEQFGYLENAYSFYWLDPKYENDRM